VTHGEVHAEGSGHQACLPVSTPDQPMRTVGARIPDGWTRQRCSEYVYALSRTRRNQFGSVSATERINVDVASLYPSWCAAKCGEVGVVGLELPGTQAKG
jgi:hypothetical protein